MTPDILCIGAVLWDIIGRTPRVMARGDDLPGQITRTPGGVALNIAATLAARGWRPAVLTAIGRDAEGAALMAAVADLGPITDHVFRCDTPTDRYMAIEDGTGLLAALAEAQSLERAGARILAPLQDGRLGSSAAPWAGPVALDGNLTADLLAEIATSPLLARADLRVAPASPGKAERLAPLLGHAGATLYLNLYEANILSGHSDPDAKTAAARLLERGARHVLVTDGARPCAEARRGQGVLTGQPPEVTVRRVTGAGDTFMAAHLTAERRGAPRDAALQAALFAAAHYISGE
jgi:sugar/nucleoside kinase (ribokinase family)